MRKSLRALALLLLATAGAGQSRFTLGDGLSTYRMAAIVVPSFGVEGYARHIRALGDGTANIYSFNFAGGSTGATLNLSNSLSCYDGAQTLTAAPHTEDQQIGNDGSPQHYWVYNFPTGCNFAWDYEYNNDPGMASNPDGGLIECHRQANDHATSPGKLACSNSNSGFSWGTPTVVMQDTSTDCSGGPCDLRGASSLTRLPNGRLIIWLTRYDWNSGNVIGTYWALCAANCTSPTGWTPLFRLTVALPGMTAPLNTLPYGPVLTLAGGKLGKWLWDGASSKSVLVFSCDGGLNWNTGCAVQGQLIVDAGHMAITLPTEETGCAADASGLNVVCGSRGCDAINTPPACRLWLLLSTDGAVTFSKQRAGFVENGTGTIFSDNMVSPLVFNSLPRMMTLCFAERTLDSGGGLGQNLRCFTFGVVEAVSNPAIFNRTQTLFSQYLNNDWGYPACAMLDANTGACAWYAWKSTLGSIAYIWRTHVTFEHLRGSVGGYASGVCISNKPGGC